MATRAFFIVATSLLCLNSPIAHVHGRLTEFRTERVPVLSHNLHTVNIDLKSLSVRAELGPRGGFRYKNGDVHKTSKGGQRMRLVQTYAKYEVYGPTAAAELDSNGYFTGQMYGVVARNLHVDIPNPECCVRDVQALVDRIIRLENLHRVDQGSIDQRDGRRVILADPAKPKAKIVYVVEFFYTGRSYVSVPVYFIDACSNSVLFHFDKVKNATLPNRPIRKIAEIPAKNDKIAGSSNFLKFKPEREDMNATVACSPTAVGVGGNPNTGQITYNTAGFCLPVSESGGTCTMESEFAKVINNENSESREKTTVITFQCAEGFSDPTNGAFGVANDALFHGQKSGEFFDIKYSTKALKIKPRLVVHYGKNYENAFWTGQDMFFGDGGDSYYPFVGLDLVAHELAHGFTTSNSDLVYLFQFGGINEAYSDITGVVTKKFVKDIVEWTIGADLIKSGKGAFRYMNDPPKDGKSIKHIWRYHPLMNVHYSSGVFNYAFYNLIDGGADIYDGYEDFLVANRDLWGRLTRFRKGACNVMQASYDNGHDEEKIKKAFRKTGIGLLFCNAEALKATVFPGETRHSVLVKRARSPKLEIDMRSWRGKGVRVTAEDSSRVQILLAADSRVKKVIATGDNYIEFPKNLTLAYVQLKSSHKEDIKVTLEVLQDNQ